MAYSIYNAYLSLASAWKYGASAQAVFKETPCQKFDRVSDQQVSSPSFFSGVWAVASRTLTLMVNTYRYGQGESFEIGKRVLSIPEKEGCFYGVYQLPTIQGTSVYITDPAIIRQVLTHSRNELGEEALFAEGIPSMISRKILGENLLTYDAAKHQSMRRAFTPFFSAGGRASEEIVSICSDAISRLTQSCLKGTVTLSPFLPSLVVEAVSRSFLGYNGPFKEITQSIETILKLVNVSRSESEEEEFKAALEFLNTCAKKGVGELKEEDKIPAVDEAEIVTFVKLMFFAGQDTTSTLIDFLVSTLGSASSKGWQQILFDRWQSSNQDLLEFVKTSEDLDSLIKEGLRLHPPSFEQTRLLKQDIIIDEDFVIPGGAELHLFHFASQRDRERWGEDADVFNPSRFQSRSTPLHYPFSFGPTACPGKGFAVLFVKMFLMTLVKEYEWKTVSEIDHFTGIALKIVPDVEIELKKRLN